MAGASAPPTTGPVLARELRHTLPRSMYDKTIVKQALLAGEHLVYGAELTSPNTATAETMAQSGSISLIFFDEDTARPSDVVNLNNALQTSPALPVATFASADDPNIKQKLDSGALGAMLKGAESGQEVRAFLDRLFFSPSGNRPGGPAKSSQYLAPGRFIEMVNRANGVMVGAVSVDTEEGARAIDDILAARDAGLNLLMVDRASLSPASVEKIEGAARAAGVTLGTWAGSRQEAHELYARGYREVTVGGDLAAVDRALDGFDDVPRDSAREPAPLREQTATEKAETVGDWLRAGKVVHVGFLMTPDVVLARQLAARTEALWVDAEHGPFDPQSVGEVLAQLPEGTRSVVRVGAWNHPHIDEYLDRGAGGIVAPSVETPQQAEAFVRRVKSRNPEALAVVMIETVKGVEAAEAIAAVEGIDVIHLGPFDLSLSLRQPMNSEPHRQAIARVERAAREAGVPLGGVPATPDGPRRSRAYQMHEAGYQFLTTVSDQEANSAFFSRLLPAETQGRVISPGEEDPFRRYVQSVILAGDEVSWETRPDGTRVKTVHYGDDLTVQLVRKEAAQVGQVYDHQHAEAQITIVESGHSRARLGDVEMDLGPGDVVVIPPNTRHIFTDLSRDLALVDILVPRRGAAPEGL